MKQPATHDFDDPIWTGSTQRNWLFVGLIVSLLLHGLLCVYFYQTEFNTADVVFHQPEQPVTFNVTSVDLQPIDKASMDQTAPAAKPDPDKTEVQLPDERKSFDQLLDEVHASTAIPNDTADVLPDQPRVDPTNATSILNEIEQSTAQTLANNPESARQQSLMNDSATSGRPQPALTGTELARSTTIKRPNVFNQLPGDSAGPNRDRAPGFSDLDSLLSQRGPIGSGTAIRMPSDPLYEYDSAALQPGAISELQKLATLIKRNPNAKFTIEGYTDTFGSPEYNMELSQRRADSVARYLVETLGVNPAQVQARGYGTAKLLVQPRPLDPADPVAVEAEIARQRPNRRVVIVVNTDR